MKPDDHFTEQVHNIVVQINDWLVLEKPDPGKLMPALAVVLGRVIARLANNETEINDMLNMAGKTAIAAASEFWEALHENPNPNARH